MAIINVDDAYILNETGAQVDKTTGIPFKNESLTEAEAAQARANIRAGGSNRNLLDNWYFVGGGSQLGDGVAPINQRGQTSYAGVVNGMDRWRGWTAQSTVTLQADGVHLTGTGNIGFISFLPTTFRTYLQNQTVTLSVLFTDGTLLTQTAALGTADAWIGGVGANGIRVEFAFASAPYFLIYNTAGQSFGVVAAKLEKGSVSTLANDPPPDFGEELEKCLRYLWVWKLPAYNFSGVVLYAGTATEGTIVLTAPVPMREGTPTVAFTNTLYFGAGGTISSVSWAAIRNNRVTIACATSGGMTSGNLYPTNAGASDVTITVSNEP